MSDRAVIHRATAFKRQWGNYLAVSRQLELDDSWPSIAVLDLLTFCLRLKSELPPELDNLLKGVSAYLAQQVKRCWSAFVTDVSLSDGPEGITITGRGGEWIPEGEQISCNIEQELRKLLHEVPYPFPVTRDFSRPISFDNNIVSLFAVGLMTGLSPSLKGAWEGLSAHDLALATEAAVKELARSSADRYARLYPKEPLGQMAELYLCKLIYPPTMAEEPLPLLGTVEELCAMFKEYRIPRDQILPLARNLTRCPDELQSLAGLVLYAALSDDVPGPEILAVAQAKGAYCGLLRRAMVKVREHFELSADWLGRGLETDEDVYRYRLEQTYGFIPWLTLPAERVRKDFRARRMLPLFKALSEFDLQHAVKFTDLLLEENMSDLDLRIQRIKLEMVKGDLDSANRMFHELHSEPGSDESAQYFNLWGLCALGRNDADGAIRSFKAALAVHSPDLRLRADIANNLAWTYMTRGEFAKALDLVERSIEGSLCPITPMLNKGTILWELRRFDTVHALRRTLFTLAPTDRRVFAGLTVTEELVDSLVQ